MWWWLWAIKNQMELDYKIITLSHQRVNRKMFLFIRNNNHQRGLLTCTRVIWLKKNKNRLTNQKPNNENPLLEYSHTNELYLNVLIDDKSSLRAPTFGDRVVKVFLCLLFWPQTLAACFFECIVWLLKKRLWLIKIKRKCLFKKLYDLN